MEEHITVVTTPFRRIFFLLPGQTQVAVVVSLSSFWTNSCGLYLLTPLVDSVNVSDRDGPRQVVESGSAFPVTVWCPLTC